MARRRPGRPRSTPADRAARLAWRNARRIRLDFEAAHLRDVVSNAPSTRKSLRIQYLHDNRDHIRQGAEPLYELILYGEAGYFDDALEPPPDGYIIQVN